MLSYLNLNTLRFLGYLFSYISDTRILILDLEFGILRKGTGKEVQALLRQLGRDLYTRSHPVLHEAAS